MKVERRGKDPLQGQRGRVHCWGKGNAVEGAEGVVFYYRQCLWKPGVVTSRAEIGLFTV
jgi:hypothetical protein